MKQSGLLCQTTFDGKTYYQITGRELLISNKRSNISNAFDPNWNRINLYILNAIQFSLPVQVNIWTCTDLVINKK